MSTSPNPNSAPAPNRSTTPLKLKPTAALFTPSSTTGKSWADDEDNSDDEGNRDGDLRESFGMGSPGNKAPPQSQETNTTNESDAPVASLLSRITGLSTNSEPNPSPSSREESAPPPTASSSASAADPPAHTIPATRPKPQSTGNNLFGKALAGVKTDRSSLTTNTSTSTPIVATSFEAQSETANGSTKAASAEPAAPVSSTSEEKKETEGKMTENVNIMDDDNWGQQSFDDNGNGNGNEHNIGRELMEERMSEESGLVSNEFQVEVKLADLQADPNSPLYSIKKFEDLPLHPDLLKGIYAVGFKKPSKIQEKALPMLLNNSPRNLIGQSQSGTGKTAAFTLNMLSRVEPGLLAPQAIVLAPSRELARQIAEVIERIGQFTPLKPFLAIPGSWRRNEKIRQHILVGTPGTLVDMLSRGTTIFDPSLIRVFVLDEADEMIAMQGLGDQTTRIKRLMPRGVQLVLFSATFPPEVQEYAEQFAPEANKIFLKKEDVTVESVKQLWLECDGEDQKFNALSALYDSMTIGQSMVFCKRKDTADQITQRLQDEGHSVASLHGDKMTNDRDQILDGFRNGKTKVLITTNVVARGIDIQQVNMVVNYDVPDLGRDQGFGPDIETYIHRIGRTGRFGRKGCSVIFVHDDRSRADVERIASYVGRPMKRIDATSQTDLDQLEKALKAAMKGTN